MQKAEGIIKAVAVGDADGIRTGHIPFADDRRAVSRLFEHLGDRHIGWPQRHGPIRTFVVTHGRVPRGQTRHKRTPRRRANRAAGIVLGKAHALCRHAVDIGCRKPLLPITPKVSIAEIIGQDINDVRNL